MPDTSPRSSERGKRSTTFDSLEAILAAASHGQIVGVLPARVAARSARPLVEITPPDLIQANYGAHGICLISRKNCDPAENEFLAEELRLLLL